MPLHVVEVSGQRAWRDFLELPRLIYGRDPNWVPPLGPEIRRTLDPARNPYFRQARLGVFATYRDGEPVARACAVVNEAHFRRFGQRTAFFGFYEAHQDPEASDRLFERIAAFCRDSGADRLEGPFNPNHYSELGLQVTGFDSPPAFFETHNPVYYADLLEGAGLGVLTWLHTRANPDVGTYIRRRYGEVERPRPDGDFRVRAFRMSQYGRELERVRTVYNDAFADNWHFLPVTAAEYSFAARYLLLVSRPRLVALVEHRGEPVGVAQCTLDVNPLLRRLDGRAGPLASLRFLAGTRKIRDVILFAAGIKRDFRSSEAVELLADYLCWALRDAGSMTTTWMTSDNAAAIAGAARFGLRPSKRFAIFGMDI